MNVSQKVRFSLTDRILEVAGIAATLALIVIPYYYYNDLPEKIPTHFGFRGIADGFGSKAAIWALPVIGIILFIGLSALNYFVLLNSPGKFSEKDNEPIARAKILRLMQVIKLMLSLAFTYIVYTTIQVALGKADGLGLWFLPTFIVLMTFLPIVFLVTSANNSKH